MLTLIASGSVSDYKDNDKSSWQQKVADAAGVDKSLVVILVAAASVRITVTISMPASMTVDAMQTSLTSTFGTADAASTALGITVESDPTVTISSSAPKAVTDAGASNVEGDSDSSPIGAIIGGLGEQNAPLAPTPPALLCETLLSLRRSRPPPTQLASWRSLHWSAPASTTSK